MLSSVMDKITLISLRSVAGRNRDAHHVMPTNNVLDWDS